MRGVTSGGAQWSHQACGPQCFLASRLGGSSVPAHGLWDVDQRDRRRWRPEGCCRPPPRDVAGFEAAARVHHWAGPSAQPSVRSCKSTRRRTPHRWAPSQSAVSELLDGLRAGDGVDLIRKPVRRVLHELIQIEATQGDRRRTV